MTRYKHSVGTYLLLLDRLIGCSGGWEESNARREGQAPRGHDRGIIRGIAVGAREGGGRQIEHRCSNHRHHSLG